MLYAAIGAIIYTLVSLHSEYSVSKHKNCTSESTSGKGAGQAAEYINKNPRKYPVLLTALLLNGQQCFHVSNSR